MKNKYLILVNKNNPMKDENIYKKTSCNSIYANDRTLEVDAYKDFLNLKKYIENLGYIIDIESGYRSIEYQQKIWDEIVLEKGLEHAKKYVAKPGYSEHQTGLAVDFTIYENGNFVIEHLIENHKATKLVLENAYKFGFILRYPKEKEDITGYGYEPWHLRYIKDKEIAKYIYDNNLCLEEYLSKL